MAPMTHHTVHVNGISTAFKRGGTRYLYWRCRLSLFLQVNGVAMNILGWTTTGAIFLASIGLVITWFT
jgi:hypothetical protein